MLIPATKQIAHNLLEIKTMSSDSYWSLVCIILPLTYTITWLVVTVWSESFGLVTQCRHEILVLCAATHTFAYWTSFTVTHVIFFIIKCGIAHFLCTYACAMRVFDMWASSSSPRLPLCQFRFCRGPRCWASLWRKNPYSLTQSLTQLIWCPGKRSFHFGHLMTCVFQCIIYRVGQKTGLFFWKFVNSSICWHKIELYIPNCSVLYLNSLIYRTPQHTRELQTSKNSPYFFGPPCILIMTVCCRDCT